MDGNDFALGYAMADNNGGNNGNCNGGMGFGGEYGWIVLVIILAMVFGWNGNGGFGNNGGGNGQFIPYAIGMQGSLTRGDLCSEFAFNDLQNAVRGVQQGICDSTFALNNNITTGFAGVNNAICNLGYEQAQLTNGVNMNMMQGFNAANVVALQNQNALQTQLSGYCCGLEKGLMQLQNGIDSNFCTTNYNAATNTTAIIQNAHNDTDRVLAKLDAMEMARKDETMARKDETIAQLRQQLNIADREASQAAQNTYLINTLRPCPIPSYQTCNPWASQAPYGSCGSCSGCGC